MGTHRQREQAGAARRQLHPSLLLLEIARRAKREAVSSVAALYERRIIYIPAVIDRRYNYAAFFSVCACFARAFVFFLAPFVCSRLCCSTFTRSITFVGFGAFFGFSSISFPPDSTFSSITSISASR